MNPDRHHLLVAALAGSATLIGLATCGRQVGAILVPTEADAVTTYDLDDMLMANYPGPRAQLYYQGDATPHWCYNTVEMLSTLLRPEQVREIRVAFVQDMGQADWEHPRSHQFDTKTGHYVFSSRRRDSIGPAIADFRLKANARAFVARDGSRLLRYTEVTPDTADLSDGALHDGWV